jgi:hypothetical protein
MDPWELQCTIFERIAKIELRAKGDCVLDDAIFLSLQYDLNLLRLRLTGKTSINVRIEKYATIQEFVSQISEILCFLDDLAIKEHDVSLQAFREKPCDPPVHGCIYLMDTTGCDEIPLFRLEGTNVTAEMVE